MFHKEFYPTPYSVVQKMIKGYEDARHILDPSAGKGDLLLPYSGRREGTVYAIEHNMDLCAILRSKGVRVLGHDFLKYSGEDRFDVVLMNPPFSHGIDHLLHAWEVCKGADVVCLLPSNVMEGRTAKGRLLCDIVERFGDVEHVGFAFGSEAERSANVDVSIIRLKRAESESFSVLKFVPEQEEKVEGAFESQASGLVQRNRVRQVVAQYQGAMEGFDALFKGLAQIRNSIGSLVNGDNLNEALRAGITSGSYEGSRNAFNAILKGKCWDSIFKEGKFRGMISSAVAKDFDKFIKDNETMAFSEENIKMVFQSLFESRGDIAKKAISDAFDILTKYYKDNRCHIEGWKTNDRWKVKRKFIIPNIVSWDHKWGGWRFYYSRGDQMQDLDIAMCFLTGKKLENIKTISEALNSGSYERPSPDKIRAETEFFNIVCHKKGTAHFVFKEEDLWNRFNREACGGRMWLPE